MASLEPNPRGVDSPLGPDRPRRRQM